MRLKAQTMNLCADFRKLVEESFDFILSDRAFHIADTMSGKDRCFVIMKSERFHIEAYFADGEANVLLGPVEASPSWSGFTAGKPEWQYIRAITGYLSNSAGSAGAPEGPEIGDLSLESQMREMAALLRENFAEIDRLFGAGDLIRERPAFEDYVKRTTRKSGGGLLA
jgi:hypothetical protein